MNKLFKNQAGFVLIEWLVATLVISAVVPALVGGVTLVSDSRQHADAISKQIPQDNKALLRVELVKFFDSFPSKTCFGGVSSVGNRDTYLTTFDSLPVVVDANKTAGTAAIYQAEAIYIPKPATELAAGAANNLIGATLWHELTHHLEIKNGDRRTYKVVTTGAPYSERHTEYMEAMLPVMTRLKIFENNVKAGRDKELLKKQWANIEKSYKEGSNNQYEPVPSDMNSFGKYSGWQFDLDEIKKLYLSGTCIKIPDGVINEGAIKLTGYLNSIYPWRCGIDKKDESEAMWIEGAINITVYPSLGIIKGECKQPRVGYTITGTIDSSGAIRAVIDDGKYEYATGRAGKFTAKLTGNLRADETVDGGYTLVTDGAFNEGRPFTESSNWTAKKSWP